MNNSVGVMPKFKMQTNWNIKATNQNKDNICDLGYWVKLTGAVSQINFRSWVVTTKKEGCRVILCSIFFVLIEASLYPSVRKRSGFFTLPLNCKMTVQPHHDQKGIVRLKISTKSTLK